MEQSHHFRDSSSDDGEYHEPVKPRECDDMLARRMRMPSALRKKKTDDYKKFITPQGDPMSYVRQHMRSKSMSDLQVDQAEKDNERDTRNIRCEELQQVKQQLKEDEEVWTSHLQSWKTRRRSATLDALKRKEDRENLEREQQLNMPRRQKTFQEMVEDKKRREEGLLSSDVDSYSSHKSGEEAADSRASSRKAYRGAKSVPNIHRSRQEDSSSDQSTVRSSSPAQTKVVVQPIRYTSKVTAVINHVPNTEADGQDDKEDTPMANAGAARKLASAERRTVQPPSSWKTANSVPDSSRFLNSNVNRPRSKSPPTQTSTYSSTSSVVMRNKSPGQRKPRPVSAYSARDAPSDRASTLPRNYHAYAAPKPFNPNASSFKQYRRTAFASKRNMWENMSVEKDTPPAPPGPQHLATLLQRDTSPRPNAATEDDSTQHNGLSRHPVTETSISPQDSMSSVESSPRQEPSPRLRPWQTENKQPNYKSVTAPVVKSWSKSTYQPNTIQQPTQTSHVKPKIMEPSQRNSTTRQPAAALPKSRANDKTSYAPSVPPSAHQPTSPRNNTLGNDSLFDDMKICINQRPRSEKGFGFTVRGGDDGKPVIVNTVSPGGAADICQLCVGDEILAINEVRLDSTLTQDNIVQLIVDSVITGSLSLDIRRYGKTKKQNPLRLSGTKVVMTPGGFVQVRSDRSKTINTKQPMVNGNSDANGEKENHSPDDMDLPPPPADLLSPSDVVPVQPPPRRKSAMSRLSPRRPLPKAATLPSNYRNSGPLTDLIQAARKPENPSQGTGRSDAPSAPSTKSRPIIRSYSPFDDEEDELDRDVRKAQTELDVEQSFINNERMRFEKDNSIKQQLLEEQRFLEEREAKREEEKRKRLEEARLEEMRLEEELKKIEAQKLEQQKRREAERRLLMAEADVPSGLRVKSASFNPGGGSRHWLIEEAERSRLADEEGRNRSTVVDYQQRSPPGVGAGGHLPGHVVQHLTNRNQQSPLQRSSRSASNPQLPGNLTSYWNDPSTQATLL